VGLISTRGFLSGSIQSAFDSRSLRLRVAWKTDQLAEGMAVASVCKKEVGADRCDSISAA